jgi:hypothetical protein
MSLLVNLKILSAPEHALALVAFITSTPTQKVVLPLHVSPKVAWAPEPPTTAANRASVTLDAHVLV